MKVFISWSGDESRQVGEQIRDWLPNVLQNAQPYFTPNDIEKGAKWSTEVFAELANSDFGKIVLTRENLDKPWVLFESGALATKLETRACPLLVGVTSAAVTGPLAQLQGTVFEKTDFKKLMARLNSQLADRALEQSVLNRTFEKWWPELEQAVSQISTTAAASGPKPKVRDSRELLEEVLATVRQLHRAQPSSGTSGFALTTVSQQLMREFCEAMIAMPYNIEREAILDRLQQLHNVYRKTVGRDVKDDSSLGELLKQSERAIRDARDEIPF
jgi:CRISPR/Cas system CSM-associated protein Csm2 small subunit